MPLFSLGNQRTLLVFFLKLCTPWSMYKIMCAWIYGSWSSVVSNIPSCRPGAHDRSWVRFRSRRESGKNVSYHKVDTWDMPYKVKAAGVILTRALTKRGDVNKNGVASTTCYTIGEGREKYVVYLCGSLSRERQREIPVRSGGHIW